MTKESTDKMNEVIAILKSKGFKKHQNKDDKYCKGAVYAIFNFNAEYICYGRTDLIGNVGIDVTNFRVDQISNRMHLT